MPSWTPNLLTGHATIDEQHRELFDRVDALHRAMLAGDRNETARLVAFLGKYVTQHFAAEEAEMRRTGFRFYETHRIQHVSFVRAFVDMEKELRQRGPTAAVTIQTKQWLVGWLQTHILGTDVVLAAFLRESSEADRHSIS